MLEHLLEPRSIAVIGASRQPGKVGYDILNNLIEQGYGGAIYPINPRSEEILGLKCYKSPEEVPKSVDMAVIALPAVAVLEAVKSCARKKIDSLVIISAGFKEVGGEGLRLERELLKLVTKHKMRLLGPNCLGVINAHLQMNASFASSIPQAGNIAFFSQSGALCTSILDWATGQGIGFSKFISLGNKSDICEIELLEALAADENTKVILGYLEGISDGRRFLEVAAKVTRKKPVIILKSGGTSAGAKAASSHTGTLAGADKAYEAAFKKSGVIRAYTIEELFDYAVTFAYQPLPGGDRLAILTNAGGPGIIAADASERLGVSLASFSSETIAGLQKALPANAATYNPVDVIGDARADRYAASLELLLEDKNVDGVLVILTPQAPTEKELTASEIARISSRYKKPVITSFMGQATIGAALKVLQENKIPNFFSPERGIAAFKTLANYKKQRVRSRPRFEKTLAERARVRDIFQRCRARQQLNLGENEAREVIKAYGFSVPECYTAETTQEAIGFAQRIGYPVVMKIDSPDILHKSDVGGVRVNVGSDDEVRIVFEEIIYRANKHMPHAYIRGVSVQQMVKGGKEVILGMTLDHQFGPMIMFGLGGIYVEVLKDISFDLAPMTRKEAFKLVESIRSYQLLRGVRGEKISDLATLVDSILQLSQMVTDFPEILEMDINPLLVMEKGQGAIAIDARITIKEKI